MAVVTSYEDATGQRCVDLVAHDDGGVSLRECRRDPEDGGRWTVVDPLHGHTYSDHDTAFAAASRLLPWLAEATERR